MNTFKSHWLLISLASFILLTACGTTETADSGKNVQPTPAVKEQVKQKDPILVVIDQTTNPGQSEHHFYFQVEQLPKGYALAEMSWKSEKTNIINTTKQAIEHGGNGEDGFYISGNGQFSGFIFDEQLKGENGEVTFVFHNDAGEERKWKKKLTLK
ncbi:hypothetical protein M5X04_13760 [Paenibacillus alvei]|uniref:Lipoprotein n=1 Tax=Paenibacillus alvei TaxID=44250 RepID=A0ABT4E9G8_PAEAL|nr:hypothetical protein [Paenibacillus alvei]MCY9530385.1 hypothetical protein [Paenibacillus alvei]